jgi:hypothetical protein
MHVMPLPAEGDHASEWTRFGEPPIPRRFQREFEIASAVRFGIRQATAGDIHLQRMQDELWHRQHLVAGVAQSYRPRQRPRPPTTVSRLPLPVLLLRPITYYVALPFILSDDGAAPAEAIECFNPNAAVMKAEALSRKEGYVVAFSRSGDPATGDFGDAKVIRKFGEVPGDLSAL